MAREKSTHRATTSHINKVEQDMKRPLNPPCLRNEVVPKIVKITKHEVVEPQVAIHNDEIDNYVSHPRVFIDKVIRENQALRKIINNDQLSIQYL